MKRLMLAAAVGAGLLMSSACSSGMQHSSSPSCDLACARSALSFTPSAEQPAPKTGLTGFGASRSEWDAVHEANPDPNLVKGCCYGPPVDAPDNGGTADTWNLAASSGDTVTSITHNFAPNTDQDEALAEIASKDLPSDATQGANATQPTCMTWIYISSKLASTDPDLADSISVTLYSPIDATTGDPQPYDPTNVVQAIETSGSDTSVDC